MIKDKNIIQIIKNQLNKKMSDNLEEQHLHEVEEIDLSDLTLSGNKKEINLLELTQLMNLKNISLQYFKINDLIINMLNSFNSLKSITFICCEFENEISLVNKNLKNINIEFCTNTNLSKIAAVQNIRIYEENKVNIEDILDKSKVEYLSINNCKIKNFNNIIEFENLKELNIDGSLVDSKKSLDLLKDVKVSMKKKCLPIR